MNWQILDCTLRDGGYYTNWDFEFNLVEKYLQVLNELPVQYCEIGYRSPLKQDYFGEYYYLRRSTLELCKQRMGDKIEFALMLDAKNCQANMVGALLVDCRDIVKLIRIAVNPNQLEHGFTIAEAVKQCGFSVATNLMYLHKSIENQDYLFQQLLKFKEAVDYVYFVDSYGACFPNQVKEIVQNAKNYLPFKIGFHGHDNLGLAFANSLAAIEAGIDIVDSTMLGLGRGAGNLRTELITAYFSKMQGKQHSFFQFSDFLETWKKFTEPFKEGLDFPYMISGLEKLPQSEVMEWMGKKRYSTGLIIRALCDHNCNEKVEQDYPSLKEVVKQSKSSCIIIGGGKTANEHSVAIKALAKKKNALIIHSSSKHVIRFHDNDIHQLVCLSGDEALKLDIQTLSDWKNIKLIVSTSPRCGSIPSKMKLPIYTVNPVALTDDLLKKDTPLGLSLGAAHTFEIKEIMLAGFDGYPNGKSGVGGELAKEVQDILETSQQDYPDVNIQSITPTCYKVSQSSVYGLID
jgi:4-hydroxy 2-oxovalerate aldolase